MTICFLAAIARIPLGRAVAIEFLGPLTVAAVRAHSCRALLRPGLAPLGVVGLTEPWHGEIDPAGVLFAGLGAVGWGALILLTQHVGDRHTGLSALALTVPIAAVTAAVPGIPQAAGRLSVEVVLTAAGLALLFPVLQYALDLLALRHMTQTAFGTLMALEPAVGVLLGLVVLSQEPWPVQLLGIASVVVAVAAAQRGGRRTPPTDRASADGDEPVLPLLTLEPQ